MPGETDMFETPQFTADDVCRKMDMILRDSKYADCMMKMKIAAIAAGGSERASEAIENFYVNAITMKKGDLCPPHLVDTDYIQKMESANLCKCCCSICWILMLFFFLLFFGFPGLLHTDKFAVHYSNEVNWSFKNNMPA